MNEKTAKALLEINQQFYSQFGVAFASTRRRLQDGVRRVLDSLPDRGRWLDLGCGSGTLAAEWIRRGRRSTYLGLDNSRELLAEARQVVEFARLERVPEEMASDLRPASETLDHTVSFASSDLSDPNWNTVFWNGTYDGVLSFAVLHHLPGEALRLRLLSQIRQMLAPGGLFIFSVWQFHHSARLMSRIQPWKRVGLSEADVDPGDTLLDWRGALPGQGTQVGLRYVHLFSQEELENLAARTGFQVIETFDSDGEGGRLGLYEFWRLS
jgi:SAM-dependent methyltransferase